MSCSPQPFAAKLPTGAVCACPSRHATGRDQARVAILCACVRAVGVPALARLVLFPRPRLQRAGPRRVLPLRLARQAVFLSCLLRQPRSRTPARRSSSRTSQDAARSGRSPDCASRGRHGPFQLAVLDTSQHELPAEYPVSSTNRPNSATVTSYTANRERRRDCHFMHRAFSILPPLLVRRRTHLVRTCRQSPPSPDTPHSRGSDPPAFGPALRSAICRTVDDDPWATISVAVV